MVVRLELIGREAALADLAELLDRHVLVTLTGPGGVGKTRLASEAVDRLDATRFPGGSQTVELAALDDASDIVAAAATQLGCDSPDDLPAVFGRRPSLLLIDNCEHVLDGVVELILALHEQTPELTILATCREPLGLEGEYLVPVEPLEVPLADETTEAARSPAVELFLERARSAGAPLDREDALVDVGMLCRRLDGMPLAIELAAARARSIPPGEMLTMVDERLDVLSRRRGDERHRSLTAVIDASYRLLDDEERACFDRLGVFRGRFDASLAHAVAGPDDGSEVATVDLLSRLVDRSLVVVEPEGGPFRYRLLETLRTYACASLGQELDLVADRFVEVMVARAIDIVDRSLQVWGGELLHELMAVYRSMISAIERCIEQDATADRSFALYLPLWGLMHDSRSAEIEAVGRRILERWPDGVEPGRASGTAVWATALMLVGRIDEARRLAAASVDPDDPMASFMSHRVLGFAATYVDDWEAGLDSIDQAYEAAKLLQAPSYVNLIRISQASMRLVARPDTDAVVAELKVVVADTAAQSDRLNLILAVEMVARAELMAGRLDRARHQIEVARGLLARTGYPSGDAALTRLDAWLSVRERGWSDARPVVLAAIEEHARLGDLRQESHVHLIRLLAWLALEHGERDVAADLVALAPAVHGFVFESGILDPALMDLAAEVQAQPVSGSWPERLARAAQLIAGGGAEADTTGEPAAETPVGSGTDGAGPEPRRPVEGRWQQVPAGWEVALGSRPALVLPAMKGLADLAVLVSRPGTEVHALELMGGVDTGDAGPSLDDQAMRAYQGRIRDLQAEIDDAASANDLERASRAELELDALVEQLSAGLGLGRRARSSGSAAERARSAVTWRLRAAVKRIAEHDEAMGRHLKHAVRTGTWCCYDPEHPVRWTVRWSAPT